LYGFSKLEWLPAEVPGHVHLDLQRNGVISDPFQNLHELGQRWVDQEDWIYKNDFELTPSAALPHVVLRFSGLDTVCRIELNGELLAEHDNMFVPLEIDVTDRLRPGKNELSIHFSSAQKVGSERRARYFAQEKIAETTVRFDERAFVRKAQYMFGWDWGPRLISAGIWDKVELIQHAGRIKSVHAQQRHRADGQVELTFTSQTEGEGEVLHYVDGSEQPVRDGETFLVSKPELWWPSGLGSQRLYRVKSLLLKSGQPSAKPELLERVALDARELSLGLRTLTLVQQKDEHGESCEFEINGRRLWAVGANWIPDSSFPAAVSRAQVRARVEQARALNMNMLRVWGGGLYESEDFYDVCDELGILVWQDFPFACSYYPDGPEAQAVARYEAKSAVERLRHRASLAIWCGNNENLTMWQDKWDGGAERNPARYYGENLYDRVLPELLRELDPERPYIASSPFGGERANSDGFGDQHYWDVWHGRGDWKFYEDSRARFSSEFGFASAPGPLVMRQLLPPSENALSLPVRERAARWHDKTKKGYETFIGYVELHYPVSETLEEWLYFSQLNQRDALRHGIEHYRRSEFCKGSLIWQLNDCWPVQSWAVIDSAGELKAAAYELQRLYSSALVSLELSAGRCRAWTVLDNARAAVKSELVVEARSLADGRLLQRWSQSVELKPGERRVSLDLDTSAFDEATTLLSASFQGGVSFRLLCEPKQVKLVEPQLDATMHGGELVITSDAPVVDLFVWDDAGVLGLARNFVTLAQPGSVRLGPCTAPERLRARSLHGAHPLMLRT
jgi:beta-mannosidase